MMIYRDVVHLEGGLHLIAFTGLPPLVALLTDLFIPVSYYLYEN